MDWRPELATSEAIARYFLHLAATASEPSPLTQMQLHKLLYYAQGWMLATRDRPLFDSPIEAWQHGPAVADLYPGFKGFHERPSPTEHARGDPRSSRQERGVRGAVCHGYV